MAYFQKKKSPHTFRNKNKVFDCAIELDMLARARTKKSRNNLLKHAKKCVIDSISEIAVNCLNGNIPLENCDLKKLSRHKKVLRQIASKIPYTKRKHILIQSGGFLPILLN